MFSAESYANLNDHFLGTGIKHRVAHSKTARTIPQLRHVREYRKPFL